MNEDLIDFAAALDISIRMTAAASPWMNGACERSHATVDRIIEKLLEDDPKLGIQKAVDLACFAKNMEITKTGFSPLQLFCGKSSSFPGYSDATPGTVELEGSNEYLKVLRRMDTARVAARQIDCDQRIKVALKSQINKSNERRYGYGDSIWFKIDSSHKWRAGKVLGQDGKVLFIKYGNFIRRVPLDFVVHAEEYTDNLDIEVDKNDVDNQERMHDDPFENVEIVSKKDMEIEQLKRVNEEQIHRIKELENYSSKSMEIDIKKDCSAGKSSTGLEDKRKTTQFAGKSSTGSDDPKKKVQPLMLPTLFKRIKFKTVGDEMWHHGRVVNKHKNKSIYRNVLAIEHEEGLVKEYNFTRDIDQWVEEKVENSEVPEPCCPILHSKVLTKVQAKAKPGWQNAVEQEIKKFENFGAFKRVKDEGQFAIKTRWVYTEADESKGVHNDLKARLCMRGDTEEDKDQIRADSPTTHKDSLKLGLAIAANEGFSLTSGDIKSAFLQGKSLQRNVYVIPPPEAKEKDTLWLLEKAAYGLLDGSRLFYLELKKTLENLGLKPLSGDPAFFTMHEGGKLIGFVCIHFDDLLMSGNSHFETLITTKLLQYFKFSKIEKQKFKYLGCEIEKLASGDISLNQNEYIQNIKEVIVPAKRNSCKVNDAERKEIRRVIGELLWVTQMTRPDLSFDVNHLSTKISDATIRELKDARRLVEKAKFDPISLNFTKLGKRENLRIKLYCDASFNNQEGKVRSTEGRVLLLEDAESHKVNTFSWKTKQISRVCRSVKAAEMRSLESGLDDAIHFGRMVREIYDGYVNLKNPNQIAVEAFTDNQGLWENLHNTKQCDEKMLRNSIALMKEMLDRNEVAAINWVETDNMLADSLTKKGGNSLWIKDVLSKNYIHMRSDSEDRKS